MGDERGQPLTGLRLFRPADAPAVARLHLTELGDGLLARLGYEFLAGFYYRRVPSWPSCFCLLYEHEQEVVGFITATTDSQRLLGGVARHYWAHLALVALRTAIRHPSTWPWFLEALGSMHHPPSVAADVSAELLSLAVSPECRTLSFARRSGVVVGSLLFQTALDRLAGLGVERVRGLVRVENGRTNALYRRLGFVCAGEITVWGARSYVWVRDTQPR